MNDEQTHAAVKELLRRPVAFHRAFARVAGGATAGLMLSQAWYWTDKADPEGWFYKSQEEWEEETALTRTEQETARRNLKERGLLEEKRAGMPARLYFRVNVKRLFSLIAENPQTRMRETRRQEGAKPAPLNAGNPQTTIKDTEITPETTAERRESGGRANFLPSWLDPKAWARWTAHRAEIGHAITLQQAQAQFRKLEQFRARGMPPEEVIEQSIAHGWQGLFELKKGGGNGANGQQAQRRAAVGRGGYNERTNAALESIYFD